MIFLPVPRPAFGIYLHWRCWHRNKLFFFSPEVCLRDQQTTCLREAVPSSLNRWFIGTSMCGVFGMRDSRAEQAKKRQCFRNQATVAAEHKSPSPLGEVYSHMNIISVKR